MDCLPYQEVAQHTPKKVSQQLFENIVFNIIKKFLNKLHNKSGAPTTINKTNIITILSKVCSINNIKIENLINDFNIIKYNDYNCINLMIDLIELIKHLSTTLNTFEYSELILLEYVLLDLILEYS